MENFKSDLKNLLRHEVADKGRAPAIFFGAFAILVYFYAFTCTRYVVIIKSFALMIVIISALRIWLINDIKRRFFLSESKWNKLRLNVWANMFCWSVVLNLSSYELQFQGTHFIVLTTILCGFTSASLITLSADMSLFLPFQFLLLGPQIIMMTIDYFGENRFNIGPLIPVYVLYLLYQIKQVKDFRQKAIQNFIFQSDLKKTNSDLQQSQDAQIQATVKLIHTSRLAALGEMAAGIAHEVNNPLAIISGSLQQLERKITKKDFADIDTLIKHTERSQQSIDRITKIINGLRLFSQQSDTLPKVKVTLNHIVDDTLNFCAEMLKARYVRLEIGEIPNVKIECHPVQISQVMINLIKNAEDALLEEKDETDRWVKLEFKPVDEMLFIFVSNGGQKIPEDIQDKLFLPFFTTKAVGKGTGLGLSISRGIMKEHGGELLFKEDEPRTTFTIILPIYQGN